MFKNYLKIAWRNLLKNKVFTLANVIGLTLAFAVAILLSMTALFELSYDQFHTNKDSIYQLALSNQTPKGTRTSTASPVPLAPSLKSEVPGIKQITRAVSEDALVTYQEKELVLDAHYVDPAFFEMFSYPIVLGNGNHPFSDKRSVAITERTSQLLFGDTSAIGKTIYLLLGKEERPFTISSILKDLPTNSSVDFQIAIPFENHSEYSENLTVWDSNFHEVYIELDKSVSADQFEKNTWEFTNMHYRESIENLVRDGARPDANNQYKQFHLLPYTDVHFVSYASGAIQVQRTFPYIILGISFLIIFIACANFINMNIALSEKRLKEIGMRKTLGAIKGQLFFQFWTESLLIFTAALFLGLVLGNLLIDPFKVLFNTEATMANLTKPSILLGFFVAMFLIVFIAGGYPAMLLSKMNTLRALKGKWEMGKNGVRNVLIVVQFVIAIILISGTLVLQGQLQFMRDKDLGYNKEQVISIPLNGKKDSYRVIDLLREELQNNPNILEVTGADNNLGRGRDGSLSTSKWGFDYKQRGVTTNILTVDHDYLKTLDIELLSGRTFSPEFKADSLSLIINQAMVKELNETDPISTKIMMDDSISYTVIGVIKDFNFQKITKEIEPLTLFMNRDWDLYYAYVKVAPGSLSKSFEFLKTAWEKIEPNAEFQGSFLDENIDRTYRREKMMATIITSGSILGIVLSCIGLFAISLLVVAQRTKEIGVRKVVGATVSSITLLLTKDFLKLVGVAFIIATPIAWYALNQWLQGYAFHISLSVWFFIGAGLLAAAIAFITVGGKTLKAASVNPVESLRTE
ncbi:ABC transporter permease [Allomuricauda sp. R78024]|uniref:ABC transporter permease n=1 Tax=Allomuricauda sp. R78024 TaxID=3093867 RepID=UPI0037C90CA3